MYAVLWSCLVYWMCGDVGDGRVARARPCDCCHKRTGPNKNDKPRRARTRRRPFPVIPHRGGYLPCSASRNYVILRSLSRKSSATHRFAMNAQRVEVTVQNKYTRAATE